MTFLFAASSNFDAQSREWGDLYSFCGPCRRLEEKATCKFLLRSDAILRSELQNNVKWNGIVSKTLKRSRSLSRSLKWTASAQVRDERTGKDAILLSRHQRCDVHLALKALKWGVILTT